MRLLFLGDVMGRAGRNAVIERLPALRETLRLDFVVVNVENSAAGFGCTPKIAEEILGAGADVLTLGDHAFDQREMLGYIDSEPRIIRPLNIAKTAPGAGARRFDAPRGKKVVVTQALGRIFMKQPYDDPFSALEKALKPHPLGVTADAVIVDFHAEATSEKMAIGHYFDGKASLIVGTHTHVPTGDANILSKGTAYMTDAGMCGDYNSVIGMDKAEPMNRFITGMAGPRFTPAEGEATLSGVFVETDDATGRAKSVTPVRTGGRLAQALP